VSKLLAKMPSQKIKHEPSYVKTRIVVLIVFVVAGLGLAGGYIISPIIHTPEPVYLTTNVTNDSTSYTPTTHTITHTHSSNNKTLQKAAQNATVTQNTKTKTTNSSRSTT
jgi:hypothetical protein